MAYKFQVGPARLSGSLRQEGNVVADGDASASNLSASTDVLAGANVVAAGEFRGNLQRTLSAGDGLITRSFDNSADVTFEVADTLAGDGLGFSGGVVSVNVDDASIETNSDSLRIKALGVTNAMLAGGIENAKLVNSGVRVDITGSPSFLSTTGLASIALGGTGSIDYVDNDFRDSVRQRMSAADFITYSTSSGEISVNATGFTGSARSVLSVTESDADALDSLSYNAATGVLTFDGIGPDEVRQQISAEAGRFVQYDVSSGEIRMDESLFSSSARSLMGAEPGSFLSYDAGTGVYSITDAGLSGSVRDVVGDSAAAGDVRIHFGAADTNSIDMTYNSGTGEYSADLLLSGSTSFEIDAGGLKLKSTVAGNGLALSAGGELSVNASALALDVQTSTGNATIAGTTDVQLANGGDLTMPSPTSGKLLRIKRIGGGDVTLSGTFSDGSPIILEEVGAAVACVGDGSNWHIM